MKLHYEVQLHKTQLHHKMLIYPNFIKHKFQFAKQVKT